MQVISLESICLHPGQKETLLYQTVHKDNARYLEREDEPNRFEILQDVDDASGTYLVKPNDILKLMRDLEIILKEAHENGDHGMCNHLREIFVLCKMCLWGEGKLALEFSPWGNVSANAPKELPDKYKINISALG